MNFMKHKFLGHIPKINVGVTAKSTEIINGGVKQNILKVFNSEGEKFMIKKEINSFSIYLSYSVEGVSKLTNLLHSEKYLNVRKKKP